MATAKLPLLLLLLLLMSSADAAGLSVSVAQSRMLIAEGSDLLIECQFNATAEYIIWNFVNARGRHEVGLCHAGSGQCRQTPPPGSSWLGAKANLNGTFSVAGVTVSQDGVFECQGVRQNKIVKAEVKVTVVVDAGAPSLSSLPESPVAGEEVTLTCSSAGANPPVRLSWLLTTKDGIATNLTEFVTEEALPAAKFGQSKSVAVIRPTAEHHEATVACTATQEETGKRRISRLRLRVRHKPVVRPVANITTIEGNTVTVSCLATGYPSPELRLARPNGSEMRAAGSTGLFTLSEMSRSEAGVFSCVGRNSLGADAAPFSVRVLHPPTANAPVEVTVAEFNPVTLPCYVTGDPMPTDIEWFHDVTGDRPAKNGTNVTLASARVEQSGLWRCVARVRLTPSSGASFDYSASASVRLRVLYRPGLPGVTQSLAPVTSGQRVTLNCSANRVRPGEPAPTLLWSREAGANGSVLTEGDSDTGQLVLPTATLQHTGVYFCRAKNSQGFSQAAARVNLQVLQEPRIIDRPSWREPIRVREGDEEFRLACAVSANPQPTMRWWRLGRELTEADGFLQQMRQTGQPHHYSLVLLFRGNRRLSVSLNDTGSFTCLASNSLGSDSANFTLEVTTPPKIVNELRKVALVNGDRLSCQFHSHRPFTVSWQRTGEDIRLPGNWSSVASPEAAYLHSSAGPAGVGNFTCSVANSLGDASAHFQVVTESAPDPPQAVQVSRVAWDSFGVVWRPGFNGGHRTRLQLLVTGWNASAAAEMTAAFEADADAGEWTVDGLFPDTTYRLRMRARNSLGESADAKVLHVVTRHLDLPDVGDPLWQPSRGSFEFRGSAGFCALVQTSEDSGATWQTVGPCRTYSSGGHSLRVQDTSSLYRVALCMEERREICGTPYTTYTVARMATVSLELIAGVAGACAALIVALAVVLCWLCCRRKLGRGGDNEKKFGSGKLQTRTPPLSSCHSLPRYHQQQQQQHPSVAYVSPTVTENLSNQTQDTHDTCLDGSTCGANNPPSPLLHNSPFAPLQVFPSSFCESDGTDRSNDSLPSPGRQLRRVVYEVVV